MSATAIRTEGLTKRYASSFFRHRAPTLQAPWARSLVAHFRPPENHRVAPSGKEFDPVDLSASFGVGWALTRRGLSAVPVSPDETVNGDQSGDVT
jgi:hypothetical protein